MHRAETYDWLRDESEQPVADDRGATPTALDPRVASSSRRDVWTTRSWPTRAVHGRSRSIGWEAWEATVDDAGAGFRRVLKVQHAELPLTSHRSRCDAS